MNKQADRKLTKKINFIDNGGSNLGLRIYREGDIAEQLALGFFEFQLSSHLASFTIAVLILCMKIC